MRIEFCILGLVSAAGLSGPPVFGQAAPGGESFVSVLNGRVTLEDGRPPERADIESVCNGVSYILAHSDAKGEFSFRLDASGNRSLQDASVGSDDGSFGLVASIPPYVPDPQEQAVLTENAKTLRSQRPFANCVLQAKAPGYRSEIIDLADHRSVDKPDLGTIVMHPLATVEGTTVSVTTLAAPKGARQAFEKGREALTRSKPDEARMDFEKAVALDPQFAAAWCELGAIQSRQAQAEAARHSFETAIRSDPKYLDPYLRLAAIETVAKQWKELAATTGEAIRLDPYSLPQAYFLNATANYNLNNIDAAEKSAREAEKLDTRRRFPGSWRLLGIILAARREFAEAASQLREYLRIAPQAQDAGAARAQLAQIEGLSGETAQH